MSKSEFTIRKITKAQCSEILRKYHYLTNLSKGFKSGENYGLFRKEELVGVCIFTGIPVPEIAKGAFGLARKEQQGLWELSRFCLCPSVQGFEHNVASWFLSRAIKLLRRNVEVRAILSYADESFHKGTLYRACNFTYYGLTDKKKDFWVRLPDGKYIKHSRGPTKGMEGEWRNRTRKHRFLMVFDKSLTVRWPEVKA